jgi:crotonobetainyl-CoA:carnitine CoA-transferase CaiB-like acyl-CoA transferase
MSLMGEDGRAPVRVGVSIVDLATGMWAVIGILAALAERHRTGRGGVVDASLYESALAWMTIPIAAYLVDRKIPTRQGSGVEMIVPYQAFAASDGYLMVAAGNDNLFCRLCAVVARPDLAQDPRFQTNKDRVLNRTTLIAILDDIFAAQPIAEWEARLEAAGIPNGPMQTVDQVVGDAQTAALGIIQQSPVKDWVSNPLSLVGLPLSFDGVRPPFAKAAPALGEDNAAVADRDR